MAIFNFGGQSVDSSNADAFVQALQNADVTISGSIVVGNDYGVTGDVQGDDQQ